MDQVQVQRFADNFRQTPPEELASLLAEENTLTPEARQALSDVIDQRADAAAIRRNAIALSPTKLDHAATIVTGNRSRPKLGVWLALLTFALCVAPPRIIGTTLIGIYRTERQAPELLSMSSWLVYKWISGALCASVLIGAIIGVHAILAGKNYRYLERAIAVLWFNSAGIVMLNFLALAVLFGVDVARETTFRAERFLPFIVSLALASLWTIYLTKSDHCRRRYPRPDVEASPIS